MGLRYFGRSPRTILKILRTYVGSSVIQRARFSQNTENKPDFCVVVGPPEEYTARYYYSCSYCTRLRRWYG